MKIKNILSVMALMALMICSGCGRNNEQISTDVKPVVEKIIFNEAGVKADCTRLLDIQKIDRNHYTATAEVQYYPGEAERALKMKKTELLKISIAYDGDTVVVRIEQ